MDDKNKNIVNLSDARRAQKQRTKEEKKMASKRSGKVGIWAWLQFFAFLLLLSYFMNQCH